MLMTWMCVYETCQASTALVSEVYKCFQIRAIIACSRDNFSVYEGIIKLEEPFSPHLIQYYWKLA